MNKKYYIISGAIILTLLVFVFVDESKGDYYTNSVEDTYALLINSEINMSAEELNTAGPGILKLNVVFDGEESDLENYISIQSANLLNKDFIQRLEKHKGAIVIVSADAGLAAYAWVILSRKGIDKLKIQGFSENETLKYTFEPEIN